MKYIKFNKTAPIFIGIMAVVAMGIIILLFSSYYLHRKIKIVVIGLDGATWDVILPLVKQGKMPTIARMMQQGTFGTLRSLDPMESPMLWTSIATGKKPLKHGIGKSAFSYFQDSNSIRTNTIWDILEQNHKRIGMYYWLLTWPPRKINGFMIPGWTAQNKDTFPRDIFKNANLRISQHELGSFHNAFNEINEESAKFFYLNSRFHPDFFAICFYGTDQLQHGYWKYMQPQLFKDVTNEEARKFGDFIYRYYEDFDKFLGKVLEVADKNTIIFIVSDHGFTSHLRGKDIFRIKEFLSATGLQSMDKKSFVNIEGSLVFADRLIDEKTTRVFVNLNAKAETDLIIARKDRKLKDQVIDLFENIRIKGSDNSILRFIREDEDGGLVFENRFDHFPKDADIQIGSKSFKLDDFIVRDGHSGTHSIDGTVIIYGKHIRGGKHLENASILDITPTILYLFGLPVGQDMDGRVLTEAINKDYSKKHPVKNIPSYDRLFSYNSMKPVKGGHSQNLDSKFLEKLRSLGYIQ